jgi:hypothetical protein
LFEELIAGHRLTFDGGGGCEDCGKVTARGGNPWGNVDIGCVVDDKVTSGRGGRALSVPTTGEEPETGSGRAGSALLVALTTGKKDETERGRRGSAFSVAFAAGEKEEVNGGIGGE